MLKPAAELRVGDVLTERPQGRAARTYRVIAIAPGLARNTIRVTAVLVTTGQRRTLNFFLVNRVEVRGEPTQYAAGRSRSEAAAAATADGPEDE